MRHRFVTLDVFTDRIFGGNPLAVLPEASTVPDASMQAIAREFNLSETTFVLPPADPGNTARVRIFTPARELPFAGHPNIGTAIALVALGAAPAEGPQLVLRFEEGAGLVPVAVDIADGRPVRAELSAPVLPERGDDIDVPTVAAALGLEPSDVRADRHAPCVVRAGVDFVIAELADRDALARALPRPDAVNALLVHADATGLHVYTRDAGEPGIDLRARMFAPSAGVPEDPATGSAAAALAGLLALLEPLPDGERRLSMRQGVEMGRPSLLHTRALISAGVLRSVHVAGGAVMVSEGWIDVPEDSSPPARIA